MKASTIMPFYFIIIFMICFTINNIQNTYIKIFFIPSFIIWFILGIMLMNLYSKEQELERWS